MNNGRRTIRPRAFAAAAAVGAAATLGLAPAAQASEPARAPQLQRSGSPVCIEWEGRAEGCFFPQGDHVQVWDDRSDGLRVEVVWGTDYGRSGTCAIATGKDYRHCNYNMAEGHEIQVILDVIEVGTGRSVWAAEEVVTI
jgi:hypothetical protein